MNLALVAGLSKKQTSILNTLKFACYLNNLIVMPFYAVKKGRIPGVYMTWNEYQEQVIGFYGAIYNEFSTEEDALAFADISRSDKTLSSVAKSIQPIVMKLLFRVKEVSQLCQALVSQLTNLDNSIESKEFSTLACNVENDLAKLPSIIKSVDECKCLAGSTKRKASGSSEDPLKPPEKKKCDVGDFNGVIVFIAGYCFHDGKHGVSAGIGVYWGEGKDNISERIVGRQTINRAEIFAAIRAAEQAKTKYISNLIIKTDSQFLINCKTKWAGWKKDNWKTSKGGEMKNKDELQMLDSKLEGINVMWVHVDANSGVAGNEAADKLANNGARLPLPK